MLGNSCTWKKSEHLLFGVENLKTYPGLVSIFQRSHNVIIITFQLNLTGTCQGCLLFIAKSPTIGVTRSNGSM